MASATAVLCAIATSLGHVVTSPAPGQYSDESNYAHLAPSPCTPPAGHQRIGVRVALNLAPVLPSAGWRRYPTDSQAEAPSV